MGFTLSSPCNTYPLLKTRKLDKTFKTVFSDMGDEPYGGSASLPWRQFPGCSRGRRNLNKAQEPTKLRKQNQS